MSSSLGENQVSHETTLFAEPIGKIGDFIVTNAYLNTLFAVIILVAFFISATKKISAIPRGMQNFFEMILEGALNFSDSITGSRSKSEKFLPLFLCLFLFILVNNWLGILPGIGTVGFIGEHGGHKVFVPFFRGGTADLNTTLALALFSIIVVHILGVLAVGAWKYLNRFINIEAFLEIPRKFKNDKAIVFINPVKAFVGLIEIVSELSKVASLSFRLFGNVFAGEVLLVSMMSLFAFLLPLPFLLLEVLVGLIQAAVFSILVLTFASMATSEDH
jgi:F-type H+-transporting ATPase subunit a